MGQVDAARRTAARRLLLDVISSCEPSSAAPYDRRRLLELCCRHAVSGSTPSRLADAVLAHAGIDVDAGPVDRARARAAVDAFADHLVDGLFLPLKATALCRSVVHAASDSDSDDSESDDSNDRRTTPDSVLCLFPPSPMTQIDDDGDQSASGARAAALLALLSLVDTDAAALLRRCEATAANRLTFSDASATGADWPRLVARFEAVLEGTPPTLRRLDGAAQTAIESTGDPRVAVLHAKMARILADSGAGAYIDGVLADRGVEDMDAGGGTDLGRLMALRLDGWWDGGRGGGAAIWVEASTFVG